MFGVYCIIPLVANGIAFSPYCSAHTRTGHRRLRVDLITLGVTFGGAIETLMVGRILGSAADRLDAILMRHDYHWSVVDVVASTCPMDE